MICLKKETVQNDNFGELTTLFKNEAHKRVEALADISCSALCCHSNETRAPIANPPNSELEGTPYHSPKLHPEPCSSAVRDRYTQTAVTTTHFATLRLTRNVTTNNNHHNRFTALFLGPLGWASARRELLDFMVQGKINRGRHTNHPAGCHSIRTNQCPPLPSSPYFFTGRRRFLPPNQQRQSTEGNNKLTKKLHKTILQLNFPHSTTVVHSFANIQSLDRRYLV